MLANKSITAYSMITSTLTEWYGEGAVPPTECPFRSSVGSCRRYSTPAVPSKWELPNPKLE